MVSAELRVQMMNTRQLSNLLRLMDPPADADDGGSTTLRGEALRWLDRVTDTKPAQTRAAEPDGAPALVLLQQGKPVRALRLGGEALPLDGLVDGSRASLRAFRRRHNSALVLALRCEALPRLWGDLQQRVRPGQDLVAQLLCAAQALRGAGDGAFLLEPALAGKLPLPSYELLQGTFSKMLPHGQTLVFYLLSRQEIWTSLIVRQRGGHIDLITSHDAIAAEAQFRTLRDAPRVLQTVQRRFGPPHVGAFVGLGTWRRFVEGDRAAIGRALAAREAILDPCPPWLLAIVGAGAMSEAATRSARLAGKLLARAPVGGRLLGSGAERIAARIGNPLDSLGLDPWELIRWGREWAKRLSSLIGQRV